ncbi:type IV pilin-like G/H family protein [Microcoleus vaginatus DQ-U2]|uniref:type IV pilin-like G/H family protein n=1 Tax=Microcoleus vaginatus TaxID=119532 RepID=UPI0016876AEC|nr:type IV pilin-like G/H family protein [Microcoleus sp. FACHB-DQ6]
MQLKKNPQLDALNKQAVSRTTMQLKTNPQLDALNKQAASSEKNLPPDKKSKSWVGTLLRITFISVPVVIILADIALTYVFASCGGGNTGKREAKQYVSSMNKGQQAIYAEDGTFSKSMKGMGIGLKTETTHYKYSIIATKNAAFSYGVSIRETKELTSYVGAVFLVPVSKAANKEKTTVSILCAANSPGNTQPPAPILQKGVPVCAAGSSEVLK